MRKIRKFAVTLISAAMVPLVGAAQVNSDLENFWNDMGGNANVTAPGHYDTQRGGHLSLGSAYIRVPLKDIQPFSIQMPGINVGCGGIDAWAGGFSHIDADAAIEYGKAVLSNAGMLIFKSAIEGASPTLATILTDLENKSDWINSMTMNSCEMAEQLTGPITDRLRGQDDQTCQTSGVSSGLFDDRSQARAECGQSESAGSTASSPADEVKIRANRNLVWDALKKANLTDNTQTAELIMTMTGVRILIEGSIAEGETKNFAPQTLPEGALDAIMGGGTYRALSCGGDTESCMSVGWGDVEISYEESFLGRSLERLDSIANTIREAPGTSGEISVEDREFISMMPLPVYRMLVVIISRHPDSNQPLGGYAEYLAEAMAASYMKTLVVAGSEAIEQENAWQPDEIVAIRETFRAATDQLLQRQQVAANRLSSHMAVQERFERMEKRVAQSLSADLAASYAATPNLEFN